MEKTEAMKAYIFQFQCREKGVDKGKGVRKE